MGGSIGAEGRGWIWSLCIISIYDIFKPLKKNKYFLVLEYGCSHRRGKSKHCWLKLISRSVTEQYGFQVYSLPRICSAISLPRFIHHWIKKFYMKLDLVLSLLMILLLLLFLFRWDILGAVVGTECGTIESGLSLVFLKDGERKLCTPYMDTTGYGNLRFYFVMGRYRPVLFPTEIILLIIYHISWKFVESELSWQNKDLWYPPLPQYLL